MAISYVSFIVNEICVEDCGDGSTCIGNFEVIVIVLGGSDPFHLEVNAEDFGVVGPGVYDHAEKGVGCLPDPVVILIDGTPDLDPPIPNIGFCCEDAATFSSGCIGCFT